MRVGMGIVNITNPKTLPHPFSKIHRQYDTPQNSHYTREERVRPNESKSDVSLFGEEENNSAYNISRIHPRP